VSIESVTTGKNSSTVSVPVEASNLNEDIGVLEFTISYDDALLKFQGEGLSELGLSNVINNRGGDFVTNISAPGQLVLSFSSASNPISAGASSEFDGTLFEIDFEVRGNAGGSPLTFDSAFMDNPQGGNVGATYQSGNVAVTASPSADFSFTPSVVDVGEPVDFDGSSSSDPDGSIANYEWDFGDGSTGSGPTPSHSYSSEGDFDVQLTVTDDLGATDTKTKTITVENESPTIDQNSELGLNNQGRAAITTSELSASDPDDGPSELTYTVTTLPSEGDLLVRGTALSSNGTFTEEDIQNGDVEYNHTGAPGSDSFEFDLSDSEGEGPTGQTFSITINGPPAVATNDGLTVAIQQQEPITSSELSASDPDDGPGQLTYIVTTPPAEGELLVGGTALSGGDTSTQQDIQDAPSLPPKPAQGRDTFTQQDIQDGNVEYNHTSQGTTDDSFEFALKDPGGLGPTGQTFSITVIANRAPSASDDSYTTTGTLTVSAPGVLENDSDPDGDALTASLVSGVSSGTLSFSSDGSFEYVPNSGFGGTDTFTYEVADGNGASDQATVTIDVNRPPEVALTVSGITAKIGGPPVRLESPQGRVFTDPDGDNLSLSASTSNGGVGTVSVKGNTAVMIQPQGTGSANVTIAADDGFAQVSTQFTFTVEDVGPLEESPTDKVVAPIGPGNEGQRVSLGSTGVTVVPSNLNGSGQVVFEKFDSPPENPSGIVDANVSQFRFVFDAQGEDGFSVGAGTQLEMLADELSGVNDPSQVTVYGRATPGQGAFTDVSTRVGGGGDRIVAVTDGFSEFVLGSNSQPLPVEISSMNAVLEDGNARLTWQTASETNNAGFEIQRKAEPESGPGRSWTKVGTVESKAPGGTTEEPQSYRFTDTDLPFAADKIKYRLRQVDLDGTATLTDPVAIERPVDRIQFQQPFPNPARSQVTVQFAVPSEKGARNVSLQMYDMLGRVVHRVEEGSVKGRQEVQVDLSNLTSGTYFVRLTVGNTTETRRLSIAR